MAQATFRVWRGANGKGEFTDYPTDVSERMVMLDAVHQIQATQANDLVVRWNCKAGKCGSCSAEVNGDVDRVQEFRKCIECFLCQDVCHVLRDHQKQESFIGPRFFTFVAALEMHPLDALDRTAELKETDGIGYCNITKCCTTVCPEEIAITDNAIIPLKERVADRYYDPLKMLVRLVRGQPKS